MNVVTGTDPRIFDWRGSNVNFYTVDTKENAPGKMPVTMCRHFIHTVP